MYELRYESTEQDPNYLYLLEVLNKLHVEEKYNPRIIMKGNACRYVNVSDAIQWVDEFTNTHLERICIHTNEIKRISELMGRDGILISLDWDILLDFIYNLKDSFVYITHLGITFIHFTYNNQEYDFVVPKQSTIELTYGNTFRISVKTGRIIKYDLPSEYYETMNHVHHHKNNIPVTCKCYNEETGFVYWAITKN